MKTAFTDVSETRKNLSFEVEPDVVAAEIDRVAKKYSKSAQVPGFRPGKVPAAVVRQRYKERILHDVAHDLVPRLVRDALSERGLTPVAAPDIKDLVLEEGQPLTFVADFETLPPIDPGDYTGISLRKAPAVLEVGAVDSALDHLQQRHARWHPVEDRPAAMGDTLIVDVTRTKRARLIALVGEALTPGEHKDGEPETAENVSIEIGATANPPGFDENLTGVATGEKREFNINFPAEYGVAELAGASVDYAVSVKGIRLKEILPLNDDFAKEVSDLETLEALRDRIRDDLRKGAEEEAEHGMRHALLQDLARRLPTAPEALVDREIDVRLEEFLRRLMDQGIDPMKININWQEFRERQREASIETVKSTLVLDEVAKREAIDATEDDLSAEIDRYAERAGQTNEAIRARLESEGVLDRIRTGIRRDKTVKWLIEKANVVSG